MTKPNKILNFNYKLGSAQQDHFLLSSMESTVLHDIQCRSIYDRPLSHIFLSNDGCYAMQGFEK